GRERDPMGVSGRAERGDDGAAGDPQVGSDRQCVAGVVVEPGDDLDVDAVGESPVGEVRLPGLVRLFGLEADVGGARLLAWFWCDQFGVAQDAVDRRS
ncbi:MAG: hypothetical protein R2715_14220, partial [Ilumatobacteraceae bacterium]